MNLSKLKLSKLTFILLAAAAAAGQLLPTPSEANIRFCSEPNDCGSEDGPRVKAQPGDLLHDPRGIRAAFERRRADSPAGKAAAKGTTGAPPLTLTGELPGTWDFVDGYLTFPLEDPVEGRLEVLLRGFPATPTGPARYQVDGWDRRAYWLNFDTTSSSGVRHLLGALELTDSYVPEPGDPIQQFVDDPNVQAICTAPGDCSVNLVNFSFLREAGRDYSNYPDGAAFVQLYFVADSLGQVLSLVAVIYTPEVEVERIDFLYEGDELQLVTLAYDVAEPDFLYYVEYMDFEPLSLDVAVELEHYVPGVDFVDQALPEDFDAASQPIQLLLEGERETMFGTERAYGGPFDLGFKWETVPDFGFASGFESLRSEATSGSAKAASLVKPGKRPRD